MGIERYPSNPFSLMESNDANKAQLTMTPQQMQNLGKTLEQIKKDLPAYDDQDNSPLMDLERAPSTSVFLVGP